MSKITSLQIDWYDNGETCGEWIVHQTVSISRNKKQITYNGYNGISREPQETFSVPMDAAQCEALFSSLEKAECAGDFRNDFVVEVCDGSAWSMKLRHSDRRITVTEGTVYYPTHGKEIEQYIRTAFDAARILVEPVIFGCSDYIRSDEYEGD